MSGDLTDEGAVIGLHHGADTQAPIAAAAAVPPRPTVTQFLTQFLTHGVTVSVGAERLSTNGQDMEVVRLAAQPGNLREIKEEYFRQQ